LISFPDTSQHKDTLGTFVSDLVLQELAFGECERDNILQRQAERIKVAKAHGKRKTTLSGKTM
jgi:hypothetical protein